jgi:hypothetical protein
MELSTPVKVITTMSQEYWDKVGQYSVSTWPNLMPAHWNLWLHDTPDLSIVPDKKITNTEKYNWISKAESVAEQFQRPPGYQAEWKMFCHKAFAIWESFKEEPTGIMIWCDSDVKWLKSPSDHLLQKCLEGKFCAYLGRDRVDTSQTAKKRYAKLTPETCIIIFDLDHPIAKEFFSKFEEVYKSMQLFNLYSWCDAAVFEHTMNVFPKEFFNDITINNPPAIAPLSLTFLHEYFEHWMGWSNKTAKQDVSGRKEKNKLIKKGLIQNAF